MRRCVIDYRAPAQLDDLLELETGLVRLGGASVDLEQRVLREGRLLTALALRLALLDLDLHVARLPRELAYVLDQLRASRE